MEEGEGGRREDSPREMDEGRALKTKRSGIQTSEREKGITICMNTVCASLCNKNIGGVTWRVLAVADSSPA